MMSNIEQKQHFTKTSHQFSSIGIFVNEFTLITRSFAHIYNHIQYSGKLKNKKFQSSIKIMKYVQIKIQDMGCFILCDWSAEVHDGKFFSVSRTFVHLLAITILLTFSLA